MKNTPDAEYDDEPPDPVCLGCGFRDCECDLPNDDCLNCGVCEWCIERSIQADQEDDDGE